MFTRTGATWTQQGPKLTGTGETGAGQFGNDVALSADGNTALIGGHPRQQQRRGGMGLHPLGQRLVAAGREADRQRRDRQRASSAGAWRCRPTGTTALDRSARTTTAAAGAAFLFARSGGDVDASRASKLTGTGESGSAAFGSSVALSADGSDRADRRHAVRQRQRVGAAWLFTALRNDAGASRVQSSPAAARSAPAEFGYVGSAVLGREHRADRRPPTTTTDVGAAWVFVGGDVPGPPTAVTATAGDGQASVSFTPPASTAGPRSRRTR